MNRINFKLAVFAISFAMLFVATTGLANSLFSNHNNSSTPSESEMQMGISEAEVVEAQKAWGDGIVRIGEVYKNGGDYTKAATNHIQQFYGYDLGEVLFKPTLASDIQFRNSFDAALSYFVGGNETYPEDNGFAIKPWTNVRWENSGIINKYDNNMAVAMGNYYFTTVDGDEVKVEYTFAYTKDEDGNLKIVAHKSALPYNP